MSRDQRTFPRHVIPAVRATFDRESFYSVRNISATGVLIDYGNSGFEDGTACRFEFAIPVFGMTINVRVDGTVIRATDETLALRYKIPGVTWSKLLDVQAAAFEQEQVDPALD